MRHETTTRRLAQWYRWTFILWVTSPYRVRIRPACLLYFSPPNPGECLNTAMTSIQTLTYLSFVVIASGLTLWKYAVGRVLSNKQLVSRLLQKFDFFFRMPKGSPVKGWRKSPLLFGTRKFITALTTAGLSQLVQVHTFPFSYQF